MGLFAKRKNVADPNPGIGGYVHARGPYGEGGYPGSTTDTRTNPPGAAEKLHDGDWNRGEGTHLRSPARKWQNFLVQQERVNIPGSENGGIPFHGPASAVNPDRVRDTEDRHLQVISKDIPGNNNQRNAVYQGGRKAQPGIEHTYKPAPNLGNYSDYSEVTVPNRHVYGGINGGTDTIQDRLQNRRMPYTGHDGFRGDLGHARGSVRGAILDGARFYQKPDTELNQGGRFGAYGARENVLHRPTVFQEPAPWSAQYYDTTSSVGGPDNPGQPAVVQNVYVSPSVERKSWRRNG